jgi:soluble lytic murein transglycosylase
VQLGRTGDAQNEAQFAVQRASDPQTRDRWLTLAASDHVEVSQMRGNDRLFDASIYPVPQIKLKGGYKIDRALLFAFARKESKFNTNAKSYSGAYGLLQLMPGTAALVENDPSFNAKPEKLLQPAINMRVGQDYILRLKDSKIVSGDLLRTIAAYNAGPRPVKDATDSLGANADSLLVMESIPVAQTREYVEEVAASYWIYRQILGQSSKSLTQATQDATIIDVASDN